MLSTYGGKEMHPHCHGAKGFCFPYTHCIPTAPSSTRSLPPTPIRTIIYIYILHTLKSILASVLHLIATKPLWGRQERYSLGFFLHNMRKKWRKRQRRWRNELDFEAVSPHYQTLFSPPSALDHHGGCHWKVVRPRNGRYRKKGAWGGRSGWRKMWIRQNGPSGPVVRG